MKDIERERIKEKETLERLIKTMNKISFTNNERSNDKLDKIFMYLEE